MSRCPNCMVGLIRAEVDHGVCWVCPQCGGHAVAIPLLRHTADPQWLMSLQRAVNQGTGRSSRPCPVCQKSMVEVQSAEDAPPLDVCKRCEFVWFDPAEYELTPKPALSAPATASDKELPPKAREALALYKVEQIAKQTEQDHDDAPDEPWKYVPAMLGLPVEIDEDSISHLPWVTWTLVAIVCLVSVAAFHNLDRAIQQFGLIPASVWRYGGLTFVTSFFLHGDVFHLLGNMYFLLIFGEHVEDYLGRWRYVLLLILSEIVADAAHIAGDPHLSIPSIGASGGIAGIITFYALEFPHARIGFLMRFYWRCGWWSMPAWAALILWLAVQGVGVWEQLTGLSNVSSLAHLGGAVTGLLSWLVWRKLAVGPAPESIAS